MTTQRINIIAPADHVKALKFAAKSAGKPFSEWICEAGIEKLPKKVSSQLSKRQRVGRPAKNSSENS